LKPSESVFIPLQKFIGHKSKFIFACFCLSFSKKLNWHSSSLILKNEFKYSLMIGLSLLKAYQEYYKKAFAILFLLWQEKVDAGYI
jgi:hypothetical protein